MCVCDAGSLFFSFVFLYRHAPRVSPSLFFIHRLRFGFLSEVVGCRRRYRKKKAAFIEKKDFLLDFRPPPLLRPYGRDNRNERNKSPPLDGSLRLYSRVSLSLSLQSNAPQRLRNGGSNSINQHIYRRPIVRNSSKVETTLRLIIDEEPFRVAGHVSV